MTGTRIIALTAATRVFIFSTIMLVLGFDIGGANLKAATSDGRCAERPFAIWKYPTALADELRALEGLLPGCEAIAVTMTAELADCYATKSEGVARILESVRQMAGGRPVSVWSTRGKFVTPAESLACPLEVAAANWHALATWVGPWITGRPALLMDIGTTTTDLIPLERGRPASRGLTDVTRLLAGELVYTGVRRTPLCALASSVPFQGVLCPVAAELFATTLDVYLLTGEIPEDADDLETANGRAAVKMAAHDRLARQLCCDRNELDISAALEIARYLAERQIDQVETALEKVLIGREPRQSVIVSGSGSFLARKVVARQFARRTGSSRVEVIDLSERVGRPLASVACAFAVAKLVSD